MPMHRWMQSAAGGTSQRLKPAVAIVCSLSRKPAPAAATRPALLTVVIDTSPAAAIASGSVCVFDPVSAPLRCSALILAAPHNSSMRRDQPRAFSEMLTPDTTGYARSGGL